MKSEWTKYDLDDLTDWSSGSTPSKSESKFWNGHIPWISASSMHSNRYDDSELKVTKKALESKSKLIPKDTILLLVRGSALHKKIPVGITLCPVTFNQDVKAITIKKHILDDDILDPWYLLYWFISEEKHLLNLVESTGIGAGKLDTKQLQSLTISVPPKLERNKIVQVAKTVDDKIELNRKMNQTLEAMAQALFKSWFVDFDPVHAKAGCSSDKELEAAAKELGISKEVLELFPDTFVESEMGRIPEGWEWKSFGEIVTPKKGKVITRKTITEGDIPVVAGGLTPAYYHNTYNVESPVITVSASGANAGFVNLYSQNIWASDCSYINNKMIDFVYSAYLFLSLKQDEITRMQQGAAQPHVYPKDLMRLIMANPTTNLWNYLEKLIKPMFKQIENNEKEIENLQKTRDTLLPKLLSGELDVSEVEI